MSILNALAKLQSTYAFYTLGCMPKAARPDIAFLTRHKLDEVRARLKTVTVARRCTPHDARRQQRRPPKGLELVAGVHEHGVARRHCDTVTQLMQLSDPAAWEVMYQRSTPEALYVYKLFKTSTSLSTAINTWAYGLTNALSGSLTAYSLCT